MSPLHMPGGALSKSLQSVKSQSCEAAWRQSCASLAEGKILHGAGHKDLVLCRHQPKAWSASECRAVSLCWKSHGILQSSSHLPWLDPDPNAAGIYREPNCRWKEDELDHAVTLMGYGRSTHGQEFWLIK